MNEIASLLHEVKSYGEATGRWIGLPLHSALSIEEQDKVALYHFKRSSYMWVIHFPSRCLM